MRGMSYRKSGFWDRAGKGMNREFYLEKCANLRAVGGRIASTGGEPLRDVSEMNMGLGA